MVNKLKKYHKDIEILKISTYFYIDRVSDYYRMGINCIESSTEIKTYFDSINGFVDIFLNDHNNMLTTEAFNHKIEFSYAR